MEVMLAAEDVVDQVFQDRDQACLVKTAITETLKEFDGLQAVARNYVLNTGEELLLVLLEGTIPVEIRGGVYYIPVDVWLQRNFPSSLPIVYVVPTKTMMLRPSEIVHSDGRVLLQPPHFTWNGSDSTQALLLKVLRDVAAAFAVRCPVVARPPQTIPPSIDVVGEGDMNHSSSSQDSHSHSQSQKTSNSVAVLRDPVSAESEERQSAIGTLEASVRSRLHALHRANADRTDELTSKNKTLRENSAKLMYFMASAPTQIATMESAIAAQQAEVDVVRASVESIADTNGIDDCVVPTCEVHEQMVELIAEDRSIEDLLYILFVAFRDGKINTKNYMTDRKSVV